MTWVFTSIIQVSPMTPNHNGLWVRFRPLITTRHMITNASDGFLLKQISALTVMERSTTLLFPDDRQSVATYLHTANQVLSQRLYSGHVSRRWLLVPSLWNSGNNNCKSYLNLSVDYNDSESWSAEWIINVNGPVSRHQNMSLGQYMRFCSIYIWTKELKREL